MSRSEMNQPLACLYWVAQVDPLNPNQYTFYPIRFAADDTFDVDPKGSILTTVAEMVEHGAKFILEVDDPWTMKNPSILYENLVSKAELEVR